MYFMLKLIFRNMAINSGCRTTYLLDNFNFNNMCQDLHTWAVPLYLHLGGQLRKCDFFQLKNYFIIKNGICDF